MIFGVSAPKFVFDYGVEETEQTVLLDYVIPTQDKPEPDIIEHKSVINGHREHILKGNHWIFEVRLNLYKYTNPRSKYEEIKQYEGLDVTLFRHRDGDPFKDSSGTEVLFTLVSVTEAYLTQIDYKDVLYLTFKSKDYIDRSDGSTVIPQLEEIIMSNSY